MAEVPVPWIGPNEVLVEVHAAALNPVDYKMIQGNFFMLGPLHPKVPGFDFSGTVLAVGSNCRRIKPGDHVHGMTWFYKTGSLAEYLAVDEEAVAVPHPKSRHLSHVEAAAVPLVSLTSYSSLVNLAGIKAGSNVLVLGGSSATGQAAIQIAKAFQAAQITTTASPRNFKLVTSLGATAVVDYRAEDVFEVLRNQGKTVDIVYDTIGGGAAVWENATAGGGCGVLAPGVQFVTITGDVQRQLDIVDLLSRGYQIATRNFHTLLNCGLGRYHQYTQPSGSQDLLAIRELPGYAVAVDKVFRFELEDVKKAFAYLMTGHARGKVVVKMKEGAQ